MEMNARVQKFLTIKTLSQYKLANYVFAYIQSLHVSGQTPRHFVCELMAQLYIKGDRIEELLVAIKQKVIPGSVDLAKMMIRNYSSSNAVFQCGIDILEDVNERKLVIEELLNRRMVRFRFIQM